MLEKVDMKTKTLKVSALRRNAGFTAIEIAMVAAVIAILSLIILPVFRSKVEEAKIAAAKADLAALMKAEQVVKADIDAYARLEDLDNVELFGYETPPPGGINKEVPAFKYIAPRSNFAGPDPQTRKFLTDAERQILAGRVGMSVWKGPYIAFQRAIRYRDIQNAGVYALGNVLLRSLAADKEFAAIQDGGNAVGNLNDHLDSRIPVDPWGNPYLFFPPTGNAANPSNTVGTGASPSAVIYSMGPNALPGDGSAEANPLAYQREFAIQNPTNPGRLGADDDLMVEF